MNSGFHGMQELGAPPGSSHLLGASVLAPISLLLLAVKITKDSEVETQTKKGDKYLY